MVQVTHSVVLCYGSSGKRIQMSSFRWQLLLRIRVRPGKTEGSWQSEILGALGSSSLSPVAQSNFRLEKPSQPVEAGVGFGEEPVMAESLMQATECWSLASRFLEMAALANDCSFRQDSCLFPFSLTTDSQGRIRNGSKSSKDTCQGHMFLTGVGSPNKAYRISSSWLISTPRPPTSNPSTLVEHSVHECQAAWGTIRPSHHSVCVAHFPFQSSWWFDSPAHSRLSPHPSSPLPRGNVPRRFLAPGLCSHRRLHLECPPSLCLMPILYLLLGWMKPLSSMKASLDTITFPFPSITIMCYDEHPITELYVRSCEMGAGGE